MGGSPATAQAPALQEGRDYKVISPAQPTDAVGKIEVLEFFSYACPHCADFDPVLNNWAKAAPKDVVLRRVPITFGRDQWVPLAKLYYTLEALNELPRLHSKVFDAIHKEDVKLLAENVQFDWIARQGIDRKKYVETYNSFTVQSKVARAQQVAQAYKIQGVPTMAVNGKYLANTPSGGTHAQLLTNTDQLINRARGEIKK
jgi:thiol:disulfide interchange protein DsbA